MTSVIGSISTYLNYPIVQIGLLVLIGYLVKKFFVSRHHSGEENTAREEELPPMEKRDFTLEELTPYNGKDNARILIAVNGKVFDVTRGKSFYGAEGPYSVFAGRDASRGLATFSIDESTIKEDYDDLSDLNSMQMESVTEWEMQFTEKYEYVGKLLKPGEKHNNYGAEESEDESKYDGDKKLK